jgi:hypothetical protein
MLLCLDDDDPNAGWIQDAGDDPRLYGDPELDLD